MSRQDLQRTTGVADYPPPALPCVCSDPEGVHEMKRDGSRGRCRAVRHDGPCNCPGYQPDTVPGGEAR